MKKDINKKIQKVLEALKEDKILDADILEDTGVTKEEFMDVFTYLDNLTDSYNFEVVWGCHDEYNKFFRGPFDFVHRVLIGQGSAYQLVERGRFEKSFDEFQESLMVYLDEIG